jgi:hypothetical protein
MIWAFIVIALMLAFNLFSVDAILKLRTDVSIIRRNVYALRYPQLQNEGAGDDAGDGAGEANDVAKHGSTH